jgi:hypothetical protein
VEGGGALGACGRVFELLSLGDVVFGDTPVRFGLACRIGGRGSARLSLLSVPCDLTAEPRLLLLELEPPAAHARQEHEHGQDQDDYGNHDRDYGCGGHAMGIPRIPARYPQRQLGL